MASDGVYWYTDLDVIAQKFSIAATRFGPEVGAAVSRGIDKGVEMMRHRVMTGGVQNGVMTGGPRARTYAMYNSIDGHVQINPSGRIAGQYGYVDNAPYWTIFQEYGTRGRHGGRDNKVNPDDLSGHTAGNGGILALHAFVGATEVIRRDIAENITHINIWKDFR